LVGKRRNGEQLITTNLIRLLLFYHSISEAIVKDYWYFRIAEVSRHRGLIDS
jgi:hypothetical protein